MSRPTRDGTAEPVSRDQILRLGRGQGNVQFPCSADHEQDWQPCPVDPFSALCDDHTYTQRGDSSRRITTAGMVPCTTVYCNCLYGTKQTTSVSSIVPTSFVEKRLLVKGTTTVFMPLGT